MPSNKPWAKEWKMGRSLGQGGQGFTNEVTSLQYPDIKAVIKTLKFQSK